MRHSRYIWIIVIATVCFAGMVWWFTPHRIVSALANPNVAFTPRATVQHFWNLLDARQVDLAEKLIEVQNERQSAEVGGYEEFKKWKKKVEDNPLLSLQKLEFMESRDEESIIVQVNWGTPTKEEIKETYIFTLRRKENAWVIIDFKRLSDLSYWGYLNNGLSPKQEFTTETNT